MPGDTLEEFYWKSNYAVFGKLNSGKKVAENRSKMVMKYFLNSKKSVTNIKTKYGTIIIYTILSQYDGSIISFIYDIDNDLGLRIYGPDYTFDNSCRVAEIIFYGEPVDYSIVAQAKLPRPEDMETDEDFPE